MESFRHEKLESIIDETFFHYKSENSLNLNEKDITRGKDVTCYAELLMFAGSNNHLRGLFADSDNKKSRFCILGIHSTHISEPDLTFNQDIPSKMMHYKQPIL